MQPDLLDWVPPGDGAPTGATLIAFPQERNVGKARHVAATYLRRTTDKGRGSYWTDTGNRLADVLRRHGFDGPEVDRQLAGFRRAVEAELARVADGCQQA